MPAGDVRDGGPDADGSRRDGGSSPVARSAPSARSRISACAVRSTLGLSVAVSFVAADADRGSAPALACELDRLSVSGVATSGVALGPGPSRTALSTDASTSTVRCSSTRRTSGRSARGACDGAERLSGARDDDAGTESGTCAAAPAGTPSRPGTIGTGVSGLIELGVVRSVLADAPFRVPGLAPTGSAASLRRAAGSAGIARASRGVPGVERVVGCEGPIAGSTSPSARAVALGASADRSARGAPPSRLGDPSPIARVECRTVRPDAPPSLTSSLIPVVSCSASASRSPSSTSSST